MRPITSIVILALGLTHFAAAGQTLFRWQCLNKLKKYVTTEKSLLVAPPKTELMEILKTFARLEPVTNPKIKPAIFYALKMPDDGQSNLDLRRIINYTVGSNHRDLSFKISQERLAENHFFFEVDEVWTQDTMGDQQSQEIQQFFDINSACQLKLYEARFVSRTLHNQTFSITRQIFGPDGISRGPPTSNNTIQVPSDGFVAFYRTMPTLDGPNLYSQYAGQRIFLVPDELEAPILPVNIQVDRRTLEIPFTSGKESLDGYSLTTDYMGRSITARLLHSEKLGLSVEMFPDSYNIWIVPMQIWESAELLARNHDNEIPVQLARGQDALKQVLRVKINGNVQFPNSQVYFDILPTAPRKARTNEESVLKMKEPLVYKSMSEEPLISIPNSRPFLNDSEYVQTSVAGIADLAAKALGKAQSSGRLSVARAIIEVIEQEGFKYDPSLKKVGGNSVYQTSSALLESKKGNCQEFSNLFSAVARHLGIPTRIIDGINFGVEAAGVHAWVEIESQNGVWTPLDPVLLADRFFSNQYIPFAIEESDDPSQIQVDGFKPSPKLVVLETK